MATAKSTPKTTATKKPAAKKTAAPKTEKKPAEKKAPAKKAAVKKASTKKSTVSPFERYKMIEVAAYYLAEKDGFKGSSADYWITAEKEIDKKIKVK